MFEYKISTEMPDKWQPYCESHRVLFSSLGWLAILRDTLGAQIIFLLNDEDKDRMTLAIFHAGPFKVGYLGFPVGLTLEGNAIDSLTIKKFLKTGSKVVHQLRIPLVGGNNNQFTERIIIKTTYITEIQKLSEWEAGKLSNSVLRNIKKAIRLGVKVMDAVQREQGLDMYRLYKQTVERHEGALRYNQSYFCSLITLSQRSSLLKCFLAIKGEEIIAFLIVGINHEVAFYLHGSVDYKYQSLRPFDLLFLRAIEWAKENKCYKYNMMDSPGDQPSLVRYKEKWGGVTERKNYVYINVDWLMGYAFSKLSIIFDYSRKTLTKIFR